MDAFPRTSICLPLKTAPSVFHVKPFAFKRCLFSLDGLTWASFSTSASSLATLSHNLMPVQKSLLKLRQIQNLLVEGSGHSPKSLSAGTSEQWSVCLLPSSPAERGGNWAYPSTADVCKVRCINLRTNKSNQALLKLLTWNLSKGTVSTKLSSYSTSSRARLEGDVTYIREFSVSSFKVIKFLWLWLLDTSS